MSFPAQPQMPRQKARVTIQDYVYAVNIRTSRYPQLQACGGEPQCYAATTILRYVNGQIVGFVRRSRSFQFIRTSSR